MKDGRVVLVRRRIDPEQADRDWPRLTEPLAGNFDEMSLPELKRQRALLDLKSARVAYAQRCGQLVEVAAIMPQVGALARDLRERLLGLGTRIGPQLVRLDPREAATLLESAHRDVLDDFANACAAAVERASRRATSGAP